jgi:hypothetical protein
LKRAAVYFGTAIANASLQFDIPKIILGGFECPTDSIFFQTTYETINACVKNIAVAPIELYMTKQSLSGLGLGGCQFVIDNFFKEPKLTLNV